MSSGVVPISEAVVIVDAEKSEFDGVSYKSHCCNSTVGRGNSMYLIMDYYSGEVEDEMCGRCLKRFAHYKKHMYDDFVNDEMGN